MGAAYDRYRKKTLTQLGIALNRNTDGDILDWLDRQPNKAGAVKNAIREEMDERITFRLTPEQETALYNCLLSVVENGYDINFMTPKDYERIKSVYALLKKRSDARTKPPEQEPPGIVPQFGDPEE